MSELHASELNILDLPNEILERFFLRLDRSNLDNCRRVCNKFNTLIKNDSPALHYIYRPVHLEFSMHGHPFWLSVTSYNKQRTKRITLEDRPEQRHRFKSVLANCVVTELRNFDTGVDILDLKNNMQFPEGIDRNSWILAREAELAKVVQYCGKIHISGLTCHVENREYAEAVKSFMRIHAFVKSDFLQLLSSIMFV